MSTRRIRTIFIGTPDFGIPALNFLTGDDDFEIVAVLTQPDKPSGRKMEPTPPPIKLAAERFGFKVLQPRDINDFVLQLKNLRPDIIIVAAYAQILKKEILSIPKYGCINIHGSLLPKCRGAACIQKPILDGDKVTGVSIMLMDRGLDTGPLLAQKNIIIEHDDTAGSLFEKMAYEGAKLLVPTIKRYINGEIEPREQPKHNISFTRELKKEDGRINWKKPAEAIERFIRAMSPWPGAHTALECGGRSSSFKILRVDDEILDINDHPAGQMFEHEGRLCVQCGQGALAIKMIQMEGKKAVDAASFTCGNKNLTTLAFS